MRDLITRGVAAARSPLPRGLAFEIADLELAKSWSASRNLDMVVRLDHGASVNEDYEEALTFESKARSLDRLILWRDRETVFVQPLVGKARRYPTVAAALESLAPSHRVVVTDITATAWPGAK